MTSVHLKLICKPIPPTTDSASMGAQPMLHDTIAISPYLEVHTGGNLLETPAYAKYCDNSIFTKE